MKKMAQNFDAKMVVSKAIFAASQRPQRGLRMPKSYLDFSAEFKNGLKCEIGAKLTVLWPFYLRQYPRSPRGGRRAGHRS